MFRRSCGSVHLPGSPQEGEERGVPRSSSQKLSVAGTFALKPAGSCTILLSSDTLIRNGSKNDSLGLFPSASCEEYSYCEAVPWGGFLGREEICYSQVT